MLITRDYEILHMPCGDLCATTCLEQSEDIVEVEVRIMSFVSTLWLGRMPGHSIIVCSSAYLVSANIISARLGGVLPYGTHVRTEWLSCTRRQQPT